MKVIKYLLVLFFLTTFGYSKSFAVIISPEIGKPGNLEKFENILAEINNNDEIEFLVLSGSLTSNGKIANLEILNNSLNKLTKPFFIIPGHNENRYSNDGGKYLIENMNSGRFITSQFNKIFIGINSGILWKDTDGHYKPEDLSWLKDELPKFKEKEIVLFLSYDFNKADNKNKLNELLKNYNLQYIFIPGKPEKKETLRLPLLKLPDFVAEDKTSYSVVNCDSTVFAITIHSGELKEKLKFDIKTVAEKTMQQPEIVSKNVSVIWQKDFNSTLIAEPLIWKGKIYTAEYNGKISCIDSTGKVLWNTEITGNITGKPFILNEIFSVATIQGDLQTFDALTGQPLQSIGFDEPVLSSITGFEYTGTKELLIADPESKKYSIAFATSSGKVYCYHLESLEEIWINSSARDYISSLPTLSGNRMIFSVWDGYIYCIDTRTGNLIWRWIIDRDFRNAPGGCNPVNDGNKVYFSSPDGFITALDMRLGAKVWRKNDFRSWESIGISNDKTKIYSKGVNNRFHIINPQTGNWIKEIVTKQGIDKSNSTIYGNTTAIYGVQNGFIYQIDSKNKQKELIKVGDTYLHSVIPFYQDFYLASNIDGKLVVFQLK